MLNYLFASIVAITPVIAANKGGKALPPPTEEYQELVNSWNPTNCPRTRRGVSIAIFNACEYIRVGLLPANKIDFATESDSELTADNMKTLGYQKRFWSDDNASPVETKVKICVVYRDKSVSCHKPK